MKGFADIHIHMLPGVDDGAKTMEDAVKMLKAACHAGTKVFCLTPHFYPGIFGNNHEAVMEAFQRLRAIAGERFPEVQLYLGNELRYSPNCLSWLEQGTCLTLNGTENVLVDFAEDEDEKTITAAVYRLLNTGFRPILAHVERYRSLRRDCREVLQYRSVGALIQVDGFSLFGGCGMSARIRSRRLIERRLVDLVCSDAHGIATRPPDLSQAYEFIRQRCGEEYADAVLFENAKKCLQI